MPTVRQFLGKPVFTQRRDSGMVPPLLFYL